MNRGELIDWGLSLRSWKPSDTTGEFRDDCERAVQAALDKLSGDCPAALIPDEEIVVLPKDYISSDNTVKLNTTADAYVLDFTPTTTSLASPYPYPQTNGTMDRIYWVEFTDAAGVVHTRVSRNFWYTADLLGNVTYHVSLDKPFNQTETNMKFRLYAPEVFLRNNNLRFLDGVLQTTSREPIRLRSDFFQEKLGIPDVQGQGNGRPFAIGRGRHVQLPAPNWTPLITYQDAPAWVGPEPGGTFKYRITYVHGKRDPEYKTQGSFFEAQLESSPGPASALATVTNLTQPAVVVSLPNVEFMQNFASGGRANRSGWKKRIYRARLSVLGAGGTTSIESDEVYHLIAEVDGEVTSWVDNGSVTPDYHFRIPEVQGYYAWKPMPHQDDRYELKCRVHRRPNKLQTDQDAPPVEPQAQNALIQLILHYMALFDKQPEDAVLHLQLYEKEKQAFISNQGQRTMVVPRGGYGTGGRLRFTPRVPNSSFSTE